MKKTQPGFTYLKRCECDNVYPGDLEECPLCTSTWWLSEPIDPKYYTYDIETYPNVFTCHFTHVATDTRWEFEISPYHDDTNKFISFMMTLKHLGAVLVGYMNMEFDYPVVHHLMSLPHIGFEGTYQKAQELFNAPHHLKHKMVIYGFKQHVKQLDLMKINHFDNNAKRTRLKDLEFCMRLKDVEDLPYPPGTILTKPQIEVLNTYNGYDVFVTSLFFVRNLAAIEFREKLTDKYDKDFTNYNDTKIGKEYFIMELEKKGVKCFDKVNGEKVPRQTIRPSIVITDVIFPYISFEHPTFNQLLADLRSKTITNTKGVFKDMVYNVAGIDYKIGTGGLHGSVVGKDVRSTNTHQLVDVDVASFYPNTAIKNKMFPQHLGIEFCDIYLDVYNQRLSYSKKQVENGMLKLALNGVYGDSNQIHSPFYDPFYTMQITINGQLLLLMLIDQLIKIPGLKMIQGNTDGVTFLCPREYMEHQRAVCKWWEGLTLLTLEEVLYSRMMVLNVNSYMAVKEDGGIKRIKDYCHETAEQNPATRELPYYKDWSSLVVPKAAQAVLLDGADVREFILNHPIDHDFMIRAKTNRKDKLMMRWPEFDNAEVQLPHMCRYAITNTGGALIKVSPARGVVGSWCRANSLTDAFYKSTLAEITTTPPAPGSDLDSLGIPHDIRIHTKNKSRYGIGETGIKVGWRATEYNDKTKFDRNAINYDYYINEANKLIEPLKVMN